MFRLLRVLGHQHWLRRGRDRFLRWVCNPDKAPAIEFAVPFFGKVYPGRLDNFIDWSVFHYGGYARHELLLLAAIAGALRSPEHGQMAFFDVGANVGNHSLFMAAQGARVFAFEPFPPVRAELKRKLEANPGLPVEIFEFGLGDCDGLLQFQPPSGANMGTGSFTHSGREESEQLQLQVRVGDTAFQELGLPAIDILKIDVEGFERQVLAGLAGRLHSDRPVLLFELSHRTRSGFGSLSGLKAALYSDHELFDVGTYSVSGPYRLRAFQFTTSTEVLVIPKERRNTFVHKGIALPASV
jgi:FkbM family methyltransferase